MPIKPKFEWRKFFFTDGDLDFVRRKDTDYYLAIKIRFGTVYGSNADNNLTVGAKELFGG